MKDIKKLLCETMYKFVKEHIDEVENKKNFWDKNQTYGELGFKNRSDMLKQIKNDYEIAFWSLTELLSWGMSKSHDKKSTDYCHLFIEEEKDDGTIVYKVKNRFFVAYPIHEDGSKFPTRTEIKEVHKVTKLVKVCEWE